MSALRRGLPAAAALAVAAALGVSPAVPSLAASTPASHPHHRHTAAASHAPARHAKADPPLTILTSGDKTSIASGTVPSANPTGGTVDGVAGVTYSVVGSNGSFTCGPTDSDGACTVDVPTGTYTITQTGVPTGNNVSQDNYFINTVLGTGALGSIAAPPYNTLTVTVPSDGLTVPMGTTANTPNTVRSGRWAVSRYNPPPPTTCTRNVALLFDLSASITQADLQSYKTAATDFVEALEGSSTNVTLFTFGTTAPAPGNATFGPENTSTSGGVGDLVDAIDALTLPSGQFTNWDAGIFQMVDTPTIYAEAFVLTDGDPTAMGSTGTPDSSGGVATRFRTVENGIFSANALKAKGTRVVAVGIENNASDGSVANLKAISGPVRGSDFFVIGFDDLDGLLTHLALADCASLSITKEANTDTFTHVGQEIEYTFTVTNTSPHDGFTLSDITVHDEPFGTIDNCSPSTLPPGETATCTFVHTVTQEDMDRGIIFNTAFATGDTPNGDEVESNVDDEDVTAQQVRAIEVTKVAAPQTYDAGDTITYHYVVENTGNVTLTDVTLTDDRATGITCTPDMPAELAPGDTMTCTGTTTADAADVTAGSIPNRATASGQPPGDLPRVEDHADEKVFAVGEPSIEITKVGSPQTYTRPGQEITYTYVVTNTGTVPLTGVTVTDDRITGLTCTPPEGSTLPPGGEMHCTATHVTTQADVDAGIIENTATVTGHPPTGSPVTDDDFEEVNAGLAPEIEITKTASPAVYSVHGQLITYTYLVSNTGNVTLRNIVLTDTRFGTITCPRTTLAPGESMTCRNTHAITATDLDEGSIFNSAAATGRPPIGPRVRSEPKHALVTGIVSVPVTG